jgi:hypothetical protein
MALHMGTYNSSAVLNQANFSYVKQDLVGKSKLTYILGIGGLAKETLVFHAKKDLIKNHFGNDSGLKENQALANVSVNVKTSNYLGLFVIAKCTLTADLVEFK